MPRTDELAPHTSLGFIVRCLWHCKVTSHECVMTTTKSPVFLWGRNKCSIACQPNLSRAKVQQSNLFGFPMLYTYQTAATVHCDLHTVIALNKVVLDN